MSSTLRERDSGTGQSRPFALRFNGNPVRIWSEHLDDQLVSLGFRAFLEPRLASQSMNGADGFWWWECSQMQLLSCSFRFAVSASRLLRSTHFVVLARLGSWWRASSTESVASVSSGAVASSSRCGFEDCGGPKSRSSRKTAVFALAVPVPRADASFGRSRHVQSASSLRPAGKRRFARYAPVLAPKV
jgi:hypothetical protein